MRSKLVERTVRAAKLGYRVTENGTPLKPDGTEMKCHPNNKGYLKFSIPHHPEDNDRNIFVHQLAALQWYGIKAFQPGIQVRHLDRNPLNNSKLNIALGTNSINQMDIDPVKRRARAIKASKAAAKKNRKFNSNQIQKIREDHASGKSIREIARKLSKPASTIWYIVNRKTYTDID